MSHRSFLMTLAALFILTGSGCATPVKTVPAADRNPAQERDNSQLRYRKLYEAIADATPYRITMDERNSIIDRLFVCYDNESEWIVMTGEQVYARRNRHYISHVGQTCKLIPEGEAEAYVQDVELR